MSPPSGNGSQLPSRSSAAPVPPPKKFSPGVKTSVSGVQRRATIGQGDERIATEASNNAPASPTPLTQELKRLCF